MTTTSASATDPYDCSRTIAAGAERIGQLTGRDVPHRTDAVVQAGNPCSRAVDSYDVVTCIGSCQCQGQADVALPDHDDSH